MWCFQLRVIAMFPSACHCCEVSPARPYTEVSNLAKFITNLSECGQNIHLHDKCTIARIHRTAATRTTHTETQHGHLSRIRWGDAASRVFSSPPPAPPRPAPPTSPPAIRPTAALSFDNDGNPKPPPLPRTPVFASGGDVCAFVGEIVLDTICCCARLRNDGWCAIKISCRLSLIPGGPAVADLISCSGCGCCWEPWYWSSASLSSLWASQGVRRRMQPAQTLQHQAGREAGKQAGRQAGRQSNNGMHIRCKNREACGKEATCQESSVAQISLAYSCHES